MKVCSGIFKSQLTAYRSGVFLASPNNGEFNYYSITAGLWIC